MEENGKKVEKEVEKTVYKAGPQDFHYYKAIYETAKKHGYTDIYRHSLIPMTEMPKLMGKATFEEILGDLIYKPPGKLTLVPNTDKRLAVNVSNAIYEFNEIMED